MWKYYFNICITDTDVRRIKNLGNNKKQWGLLGSNCYWHSNDGNGTDCSSRLWRQMKANLISRDCFHGDQNANPIQNLTSVFIFVLFFEMKNHQQFCCMWNKLNWVLPWKLFDENCHDSEVKHAVAAISRGNVCKCLSNHMDYTTDQIWRGFYVFLKINTWKHEEASVKDGHYICLLLDQKTHSTDSHWLQLNHTKFKSVSTAY